MNEIISKMMFEIAYEEFVRKNYQENLIRLRRTGSDSAELDKMHILYHRACAALIAMKEMFQIVTGSTYEAAVERMGKGA